MSSAFYRSVPRGANGGSSNPVSEKKLDDILLAIGEQKNRMRTLEENGTKTLKSVENLEERMIVLEDKIKFAEEARFSGKIAERSRIPPELSVIFISVLNVILGYCCRKM